MKIKGFCTVIIGIDTKIEVIVVSPTTWEAHHSPRAKPEGCGELPRSYVGDTTMTEIEVGEGGAKRPC